MDTTQALINDSRNGDVRAALELVARYEADVRAFAAVVSPRPDLADDIAQEAFLECLKSAGRYDPSKDFGLWIRGIVRNVAYRSWQRLQREHRAVRDGLAAYIDEVASRDEAAEGAQARRESIHALQECIDGLPERSKEIVTLRYALEVRCAEIASKVGTSLAAVKMALLRIRRALRECVDGRLGTQGETR